VRGSKYDQDAWTSTGQQTESNNIV